MKIVLGAGLAGLSTAYHAGRGNALILEKKPYAGGHIHAEMREGFTWDEGPHVSFTPHEYVKSLFEESTDGEFEEYPVVATNYYRGSWIEHPAQSNLYQVPEPLRAECIDSFLKTRNNGDGEDHNIENYGQWLDLAFGPVFAKTFPAAYTRKYWTVEPEELGTDWVGSRVFYPEVDDVIQGAKGPLDKSTHYIKKVRYPSRGGYLSFAKKLIDNSDIRYGCEVSGVDLKEKKILLHDGSSVNYESLVNSIPLPQFVRMCKGVPAKVLEAANALDCTSVLLVNVTAPHPTLRPENWIYVYDEDKLSSRIYCTEKMAPSNAPQGHTGVQVEVYFSRYRPFTDTTESVADTVVDELVEMGLIDPDSVGGKSNLTVHTKWVPWANVLFHHQTKDALDVIWKWMEQFGLERESDDLLPLTDWNERKNKSPNAPLSMAGRFGQWKYYWTDDCVMRGALLNNKLTNNKI